MGVTGHPIHPSRSKPTNFDLERVYTPQKNFYPQYQGIPSQYRPDWGRQYCGNVRPFLNYATSHERSSYSGIPTSPKQIDQKPFHPSYTYYNTPQVNAGQVKVSPRSNSNATEINGSLQERYQHLQNGNLNHPHILQGALFNGGLPGHYSIMPSPQIQHFPLYPMMYDHQHTFQHTMPPPIAPQAGTIITTVGTQLGDNRNDYATEPNGFHHEHNSGSSYIVAPSQTKYPQMYINTPDIYDPLTQYGNSPTSSNHHNTHSDTQQTIRANCLKENDIEIIQQTAHRFVETFCPHLGKKTYCLPPIKRQMHPDKQLVLAMESEKRVLGSFERFFTEHQFPVFMLCHYPVTGFMQVFNGKTENLDRDPESTMIKSDKNTVTLLLLSHLFSVTIVTISIISGNSDLTYIQRGVHKAGIYNKRCANAVTSWFKFLGIRSEVRQVIAFPNLKRVVLHRIRNEKQFKQNYGSLCTLHNDDLPAPFEEEWSTEVHKQLFISWIQRKVLCHSVALSGEELHLVVGALLSPRLSKVDFVHDEKEISPIVESTHNSFPSEQAKGDVTQLKLTVDGLTKSFDEFMDEYVSCYYPNIEVETYRVPPIHFNIQSLKKPSDYLPPIIDDPSRQIISGSLEKKTKSLELCTMKDGCKFDCKTKGSENSEFMPPCHIFTMQATRNSYCSHRTGPVNGFQVNNSTSISSRKYSDASASASMSPENARLGALQDVKVLSQVMTKDSRADEGENRVITALEMLGRRFGPMFIICGYQYNNYLNKLREEMFSREDAKRPVRAFGQTMRAEHDCLIFHKKYGAIIVCIKAVGDNFKDWSASEEQQIICTNKILEKAVKQLDREEAMIRHVTSDLQPNLACHKLIALPNMTRESVEKALSTDDNLTKTIRNSLRHGADIFLCSDELPPQHQPLWDYEDEDLWRKLKSWWMKVENLFTGNQSGGITPQIYRQLIGRYCGLFSTVEVWSPTNPRVEVRSTSEAINLCADRFRKMILLPNQITALSSNERRVFLYGPPGSGKTLLLILKAKEWLLTGETVILINSRPHSVHGYPCAYGVFYRLRQMMKEFKINYSKLSMINIDPLQFKADNLAGVMPSSCIIMDEVSAASHEIVEHLSCLQVKHIWCAGPFEEDKPNTAHSFSSHKMDVILRCPPIVQSLLKHTEQNVRSQTPYWNNYQGSFLEGNHRYVQSNSPTLGNNSDPETLKNSQSTRVNFRKSCMSDSELEDRLKCSEVIDHKLFVPEDVCPENRNLKSKTHKELQYSSKLLDKRLNEKFGIAQKQSEEAQNTSQPGSDAATEISSVTYSHSIWAATNSSKLRKLFPGFIDSCNQNLQMETLGESLDSNPHSLNSRLMDKYSNEPQKKEELQVTSELEIHRLTTEDHVCVSELLNKRLKKYDRKCPLIEEPENKNIVENNELLLEKSLKKDNRSADDEYEHGSLSKRLEKYNKKTSKSEDAHKAKQMESIDNSYYRFNTNISFPTYGPRPHIINHSFHSQPGSPTNCSECGNKLADFLKEMIIPQGVPAPFGNKSSKIKKKHSLMIHSVSRQPGKTGDTIIFSNISSIHSKLPTFSFGQKHVASFGSRALNWSDVLIVAREMPNECPFVSALRSQNIPVKILMSGQTSEIESSNENKLFITSYKEVTGLERAIIIFVPSDSPNSLQQNFTTKDIPDLKLGHSIEHLTDEDRMVLWYVASRSLASLVIILP